MPGKSRTSFTKTTTQGCVLNENRQNKRIGDAATLRFGNRSLPAPF
jgi:hypothetical protein